jgi:hypothetical protein
MKVTEPLVVKSIDPKAAGHSMVDRLDVGCVVGDKVGLAVGLREAIVGDEVGIPVGLYDGSVVGISVGKIVGTGDGAEEGMEVGR